VYWAGGFLSNVGTWLQAVAASVFVYQLTGSALAVGILNFAAFLPILLFSVVGGVLSDRFDRRWIVIVASAVSGVVACGLAALTFADAAGSVHVTVTAFAINTAYAFAKPALSSLLPALVSRADMSEAVSLNSLQFVTGQLVGPLVASLVLVLAGPAWAFLINAATFAGPIAAMLYLVRAGLGGRATRMPGDPSKARQPGSAILTFLRAESWVGPALLGVVCTSAALEIVRTLSPVLAAQSLHVHETDAGLIVAAQSAGSAVGLLLFVPLRRRAAGVHLASLGLGLQAGGALGASVSTLLAPTAAAVALNGLGFAFCFPVLTGLLQGDVPDGMRGRVMSLHTVAHLGNRPFAALAAGSIANVAGASTATMIGLLLAPIGLVMVRRTWRVVHAVPEIVEVSAG
jgi:MFS family permease